MKRRQPLEIALAINVGVTHLERVVRGIRDYANRHTDWRFLINPETHYLSPTALEGWHGDGAIALANNPEEIRVLKSLNCPVVNLSGASPDSNFPRVRPDYDRIGRMAAWHLLDRGYRRFGFYGITNVWYSEGYEAGFRQELSARGLDCSVLNVAAALGSNTRWDIGQGELELWLGTINPPFAVMAAHDPRAAMVIRACERVGLRVPEDVAVIGVNNDTVACESCHPPLSSIERNDYEIGEEAARLLDRLIQQKEVATEEKIIAPGAVQDRQSTDSLAVDHPDLLKAIEYSREHFREPIGVADIVEANPRSRRWLEDAFVDNLGCTPRNFLFRLRIREAQKILTEMPDTPPGEVALRCGYSGTRQLNAHFRSELGMTAREFTKAEL
tara:strand:- start:15675 stop:16832 length:1158 start_codon:yes stop_codon:yes gene_type:complete